MTIRQWTMNCEFASMKHLVALGVFLAMTAFASAERPPTKSVPVTDNDHGVSVTEHFPWLEDWNNPAVRMWSADQNTDARSRLDKLRASAGSGYGGDTALAERIEQSVDVYAFLYEQPGYKFHRGAKQPEP